MLSVSSYTRDYVASVRKTVDAQLAAYSALKAPPASFDRLFFNNMILALDHCFMHRARAQELKDGNPVNEMRVLANSIMENGAKLIADKQIKLDPARSVTGLKAGDDIVLSADGFARLAKAFLTEIEKKYP